MTPNRILFRPHAQSTVALPLSVRCTAYYVVTERWGNNTKPKPIVQLFWCLRGSGWIWIKGTRYALEPGWVAFYVPGDRHHLEVESKPWHVRWISMDGPSALSIVQAFGLRQTPFHAGKCPEFLFEQLAESITDLHPGGEILASVRAYHIIASAASYGHSLRGLRFGKAVQIKDHIDREAMNPQFSVATLAEACGIHRSTVSRLFVKEFGVSPSEYLKRVRLQYGLTLLNETQLSVTEIASRCGFQDPIYFGRLIKERWDQLPREIRDNGNLDSIDWRLE